MFIPLKAYILLKRNKTINNGREDKVAWNKNKRSILYANNISVKLGNNDCAKKLFWKRWTIKTSLIMLCWNRDLMCTRVLVHSTWNSNCKGPDVGVYWSVQGLYWHRKTWTRSLRALFIFEVWLEHTRRWETEETHIWA